MKQHHAGGSTPSGSALIAAIESIEIEQIPMPESLEESVPMDSSAIDAAINSGSVVSFVAGLDAQEKDDVINSTQFAQRAASKQVDRIDDVAQWYDIYNRTLGTLGWVTEQFAFTEYEQGQGDVRMDSAAIRILTSLATAGQLTVLKDALEALRSLSEGRDITLFERRSSSDVGGNFQIGAAQRADNGAVGLVVGAFYFNAVNSQKNFLFARWGNRSVNLWTAAQRMTLNGDFYDTIRETVRDKLGAGRQQLIRGIKLA